MPHLSDVCIRTAAGKISKLCMQADGRDIPLITAILLLYCNIPGVSAHGCLNVACDFTLQILCTCNYPGYKLVTFVWKLLH